MQNMKIILRSILCFVVAIATAFTGRAQTFHDTIIIHEGLKLSVRNYFASSNLIGEIIGYTNSIKPHVIIPDGLNIMVKSYYTEPGMPEYVSKTLKVKNINTSAFKNAPMLTVSLPNGMTVDSAAFENCPNLYKLHAPRTGAKLTFRNHAFINCNNLYCIDTKRVDVSRHTFDLCWKNYKYSGEAPTLLFKDAYIVHTPTEIADSGYIDIVRYVGDDKYNYAAIGRPSWSMVDQGYGEDFKEKYRFHTLMWINAVIKYALTPLIKKDLYFVDEVNEIREYACTENTHVENVYFSRYSQLDSISEGVFYKCSELNTVKFGYGIRRICTLAFAECPKLSTLMLPYQLETIHSRAFSNCISLPAISLPETMEQIEPLAFDGCGMLSRIDLHNIPQIENLAFARCEGIRDVYIHTDEAKPISPGAFPEPVYNLATLWVPAGSEPNYRATAPWNKFKTIKPIVKSN